MAAAPPLAQRTTTSYLRYEELRTVYIVSAQVQQSHATPRQQAPDPREAYVEIRISATCIYIIMTVRGRRLPLPLSTSS